MDPNLNERRTLVRGLGLIAAISVIIGNVIGTGVFLKARVMTCNVGEPSWVLIAWIAAGLLSLAGALTYAELTSMKPHAGAEYVFLRDAYGRTASFLYGWMQFFIAKAGSQASVAVVFAIAVNDFLDGRLRRVLLQTEIFGYPYEITSLQIVAIMVIVIFTTLNCASVSFSGQIATALTFVKIGLVLLVAFGAFLFVTGGDFANFTLANTGGACEGVADAVRVGSAEYTFAAGFAAAMLGALWGYDGWNNLTFVAGEVKDPSRNIPIALIGSVVLVIVLYVLAHVAYYYVLDPTAIASVSKDSSVAKVVVSKFFGGDAAALAAGVAVAIFTVGLMISSLGTLHTSILAGSRTPYAMAQDRLMFRQLGMLSITGVPVNALIVQGIWASILALSGSFDTLTDYVIFGSWIFYALVTSSVFVFRRKYPDAERPYRAWGYPVVPIVFLIVAGWLLFSTFYSARVQMLAGLEAMWNGIITFVPATFFSGLWTLVTSGPLTGIILIILGLPVYYYLNSKGRNNGQTADEE